MLDRPSRRRAFGLALGLAAAIVGVAPAFAQSLAAPGAMNGGVGIPGVLSPAPMAPSAPVAPAPPASSTASTCQADFGRLAQKRMENIAALNNLAKENKGKLDPIAACPKFRNLVASEKELVAYVEKNKEWCNGPDQIVEQVKEGASRDEKVGDQACKIAAQVKKQQQMQAAGGGGGSGLGGAPAPKLPSGPL